MHSSKYSFLKNVPCLNDFKHTNQAINLLDYFLEAQYKYIPSTFVYIKLVTEVRKEDDIFDPIDVCGIFWKYFDICLRQNNERMQPSDRVSYHTYTNSNQQQYTEITQAHIDEYISHYTEVTIRARKYQMQILKFELRKDPTSNQDQDQPASPITILIQRSLLEALVVTRNSVDAILKHRAYQVKQQPMHRILGLHIQSPTVTKVSDYQKTIIPKWRSQKYHKGEPR